MYCSAIDDNTKVAVVIIIIIIIIIIIYISMQTQFKGTTADTTILYSLILLIAVGYVVLKPDTLVRQAL